MLWMMSLAFGGFVEHGFEPPGSLQMFTRVGTTGVAVSSKDKTCEALVAEAMAELESKMSDGRVLVEVWPQHGRDGWNPIPDVECVEKGKKRKVSLLGGWISPGEGAAYPELPRATYLKYAAMLQATQIGTARVFISTDHKGRLVHRHSLPMPISLRVPPKASSNSQAIVVGGARVLGRADFANQAGIAVVAINDSVLQNLFRQARLVAAIPELGAATQDYDVKVNRDGVLQSYTLRVTTGREALEQLAKGQINTRQAIRRSGIRMKRDDDPDVPFAKVQIAYERVRILKDR